MGKKVNEQERFREKLEEAGLGNLIKNWDYASVEGGDSQGYMIYIVGVNINEIPRKYGIINKKDVSKFHKFTVKKYSKEEAFKEYRRAYETPYARKPVCILRTAPEDNFFLVYVKSR